MKYILITAEKMRYAISEKEKSAVFEAIKNHESHVVLQGEMIPLQIIPTIVSFQRWWASESEKLIVSGKKLCRICLKIYYINDVCKCWDSTLSKKQNAFKAVNEELPTVVQKALGAFKDFPQLTEGDKAQLSESNPQNYLEKRGFDGYIDEESGEEIFS